MNGKILWVEDEPSLRSAMGPLVEEKGFQIVPTSDLNETLRLYTNHLTGLAAIIADAAHPGRRERELAALNFKSKMAPMILFTSRSDAEAAVELLDYGVRDYLTKPVSAEKFMMVLNNALGRDKRPHGPEDKEGRPDMGVDFLVIRSRMAELNRALEWISKRTDACFSSVEMDKFLCFVNEYLLNAHEHGNMRISEEEKIRLLESDAFLDEVRSRESFIDARIEIAVVRNGSKVSINITDEGAGFDFARYMSMSKEGQMNRLFSPCGRGILITCHYFDSIEFAKGGRSVTLVKRFSGEGGD